MPWEYIIGPAITMTILPRIASRFETWRKGEYRAFTYPKFFAKMLYMSLAFLMIFVDWRFSMSMYFGVIVYLLNCWIGHLKVSKKTFEIGDYGTYGEKGLRSTCIGMIAFLGFISFIYCTTTYGCLAVPVVLVPYGFKLFNNWCENVSCDDKVYSEGGISTYFDRSDPYFMYGGGSRWTNYIAYMKKCKPDSDIAKQYS